MVQAGGGLCTAAHKTYPFFAPPAGPKTRRFGWMPRAVASSRSRIACAPPSLTVVNHKAVRGIWRMMSIHRANMELVTFAAFTRCSGGGRVQLKVFQSFAGASSTGIPD